MSGFLDAFANFFDFLDCKSPLSTSPKIIPARYIINTFKFGTLPFMFAMMIYFDNFTTGAWLYLALHGSYGLLWITKDLIFPDKSFTTPIGPLESVLVAVALMLYWTIGLSIMVEGPAAVIPSNERIFICVFMYAFGVFLMLCTDIQKYVTLRLKKGLISDLMVGNCRNTNYVGEILIYMSFAVLSNKWSSYITLISLWSGIFVSRIYLKEKSLRKKDGGAKYIERSYLLLFKFFESDLLNLALYCSVAAFSFLVYNMGGIEACVNRLRR